MTSIRPVEPDVNPQARAAAIRARRARGRAGFTIVEIMTVIAIILILVGMAAIAYKTLDNPTSGRSTKVALDNLQAQLADYEAQAGLRNQPQNMWRKGALVTYKPAAPAFNIWKDQQEILADTGPNGGDVSTGGAARYGWDAIGNTQRVYQIIQRVPANKSAITRLPSRQVHGVAEDDAKPTKLFVTSSSKPWHLDPPLILDAWNNPIIFVGSRGLAGVALVKKPGKSGADSEKDFDKPDQQVTSVGVFPNLAPTAPTPAGARPFFASAGPDGNFRTGDDNVYSFNP